MHIIQILPAVLSNSGVCTLVTPGGAKGFNGLWRKIVQIYLIKYLTQLFIYVVIYFTFEFTKLFFAF